MDSLKSIERVIDSFSKLPSIGRKSAERMAYALLDMSDEEIEEFSRAIKDLKLSIHHCPKCGMLIDTDSCPICDNPERNHSLIMVVSNSKDVISIEKSGGFDGIYHVLNGEISLNKGMKSSSIDIDGLVKKVEQGNVKEVILATNPTIDGETTALYISKVLEPFNVTVTRLAYGLQMGGNIDYTDQVTLLKALEGRRKL